MSHLPTPNSPLSPSAPRTFLKTCALLTLAGGAFFVALSQQAKPTPSNSAASQSLTELPVLLPTGKLLTPSGTQTDVGSYPANLILSPDGRFILVSTLGFRESLSVLRASDGALVSRLDWNDPSPVFPRKKRALYFGLSCGTPRGGQTPVYASCGGEATVAVLSLSADGILTKTGRTLGEAAVAAGAAPSGDAVAAPVAPAATTSTAPQSFLAGLATSSDGTQIFAADNSANPKNAMRGGLQILDAQTGAVAARVDLPGYPFAVAAAKNGMIYVSSEQSGAVSVVDASTRQAVRDIPTGTQPAGLLLDASQKRLFVSNAGSDTLSVIDTTTNRVTRTVLLRPDNARGLPGATPLGMAISPDQKRLFVAMADLNAVAVVELPSMRLAGYVPVGWYPTSVAVSPDGRRLFVANAKGIRNNNPNGKPLPNLAERPQYIQNIIEGTVSTVDLGVLFSRRAALAAATAQVLQNNRGGGQTVVPFRNPGIKHVFYIIKENRTYDQILGDVPRGNGDPSLALFGRDVTPNLHALAERFALLDNFYCCAEVSGDGWNWSTGGMLSAFSSRNVTHNYAGRQRSYDFEGTNSGIAVDRQGLPDVARPPGGYIWDLCASHGVGFRNYGFFVDDFKLPRTMAEEGTTGEENSPTKKALVGHSDANYRQFDMTYADSEAWQKLNLPLAPSQKASYGTSAAPSRVTAWRSEFEGFVKSGNLPAFSMLRLPRDHTSGTTAGASSPRAMVADNDFAVGQIVETISHSPYWQSSAIVIVEDDAQNGYDHIDAHRSTAYVISPFVERARLESRFYNTDSALKTIEALLGLPPMTAYDGIAAPIDVFTATAKNSEAYTAILPSREIIGEVNTRRAPGAVRSARLLNPLKEESAPDEELNAILWRSIKNTTPPPRHYSLSLTSAKDADD